MVPPAETETELGSVEASKRLGIRTDYLLMLARCGKIEGRKQDGTWRFPISAIEQRQRVKEQR